jgi:hypothetical protein
LVILIWLAVQALIASSGFYTVTDTTPPRFLFLVLPPLLGIAGLFLSPKGREFIDGLDLKSLTILHTIRIPVELVLFFLFTYKAVPELMTFEGRNFDILSGITAPVIFYFAFIRKQFEPESSFNLECDLPWIACKYCKQCHSICPISLSAICF